MRWARMSACSARPTTLYNGVARLQLSSGGANFRTRRDRLIPNHSPIDIFNSWLTATSISGGRSTRSNETQTQRATLVGRLSAFVVSLDRSLDGEFALTRCPGIDDG